MPEIHIIDLICLKFCMACGIRKVVFLLMLYLENYSSPSKGEIRRGGVDAAKKVPDGLFMPALWP